MNATTPQQGSAPPFGFSLAEAGPNGAARRAALADQPGDAPNPTSLVSYASSGRVLIIGEPVQASAVASQLGQGLECTILIDAATATGSPEIESAAGDDAPQRITANLSAVEGHLGAFEVRARVDGVEVAVAPSLLTAHKPFDIVLDLGDPPQIGVEVPPPGYFAPCGDAAALASAITAIDELVGEFEKPKYFKYNADICAHGRSGVSGCTRCLDACPTGAIRSLKELVEVDPYLCQGAGSCATACPSGAITYAYPGVSDLLRALRATLGRYRDAGGTTPWVLFYDVEAGLEWMRENAARLPEHVIPAEVEEVGAVGLDAWLTAIAYGACRVLLLRTPATPARVVGALEAQRGVFEALLGALGYPRGCVQPIGGDALLELAETPFALGIEAARFDALEEKRTNIRLALDHLHAQAPAPAPRTELPTGAPFGEIRVDAAACTLCMACVSVCPGGALADGGSEPKLAFIEWNCVQCGICERACPEQAITRLPRFLFDPQERQRARVLNQDAPFHCVTCGKPFATSSVIARMHEKLEGHWMFAKPEALARLSMCEDCRVKDMFRKEGDLPDVHGGS